MNRKKGDGNERSSAKFGDHDTATTKTAANAGSQAQQLPGGDVSPDSGRSDHLSGERISGEVTPTRPVSAITVGKRARKDYGDIDELARSIDEFGLLQPIVITPDGQLIGGGRRFAAWQRSRFADQPIPVHIRGDIEVAIGELVENEFRQDLRLSEKVTQWREVEPLFREAARKRQREHGSITQETGRLRDDMKRITGKSGKTLEKAIRIVEAAENEPKKYGHLVSMMDEHGADGAYKQLQLLQRDDDEPQSVSLECDDDTVATLLTKKVNSKVHRAIMEVGGHLIRVAPNGLRSVCDCGAVFTLPHRRGDVVNRNASELAAHIEAHWRAVLAEEKEGAS